MPGFKRKYKRSVFAHRKRRRARRRRFPRGSVNRRGGPLRPRIYRFKRTFVETIRIGTTDGGWVSDGANGFYKKFKYQLTQLPAYQEFTELFTQYKITGALTRMYYSNTSSDASGYTNNRSSSNMQILLRQLPNVTGDTTAVTETRLNESQSVKRRLCLNGNGRPVVTYQRLKQMAQVDGVNDAIIRPKMITVSQPAVDHLGMDMHMVRVDGLPFTTGIDNYQYCRIETTLYITMKQVH